ncbi:MAG: hypothetical protein CME06_06835 [Gemmatimonadetes bacterium]|nr:hypothetical protein [Gemmatimonadota bacterium]
MRAPPEERSATAARILEAADELLADVGYEGVSMRDVAERAGVNKALVFYYFNSKVELFDRVLERYYAAHLAALSGAIEGTGPLRERLHRVVDAYLDFIEENRRYPRLIQQQVAGGDTHHELIRRNLAPLMGWAERTFSEVAPLTGPLAARHIFVTFSGIVINYYTYAAVLGPLWGDDPASPPSLAERRAHVHWMADTVLDGLESESVAPRLRSYPGPAPTA